MRHKRKHSGFNPFSSGEGEELSADDITKAYESHSPVSGSQREWWWVITRTKPTVRYPDGQVVSRGAYSTEEQAENEGERIGREFETVKLPTRDTNKAMRMWRNRRMERGQDLEKALERQRHQGQEFGD